MSWPHRFPPVDDDLDGREPDPDYEYESARDAWAAWDYAQGED